MQTITGEVSSSGVTASSSAVNIFLNRVHQISTYPAAVVAPKKPLQAAVLEASNHSGYTVNRMLSVVKFIDGRTTPPRD